MKSHIKNFKILTSEESSSEYKPNTEVTRSKSVMKSKAQKKFRTNKKEYQKTVVNEFVFHQTKRHHKPFCKQCKISNIWKVGWVIPLHKPGKPIDKSKSFRPIALLSLIAKLAEKLLIDFIEYSLKEHQHGFRPEHSTTRALKMSPKTFKKALIKDLATVLY